MDLRATLSGFLFLVMGVPCLGPHPVAAEEFIEDWFVWESSDDGRDWTDGSHWYFQALFPGRVPPNDGRTSVTLRGKCDTEDVFFACFYPKIGSDPGAGVPFINIGELTLDGTPGSPLYLLQGSLSTDTLNIGWKRLLYGPSTMVPTFRQVSGTTTTVRTSMQIGLFAPDDEGYSTKGAYVMSGGTLTAPEQKVGVAGTGSFSQTGGVNTVNGILWLGDSSGGMGTYTLGLSGELHAVREYVGFAGTGTFDQSGGMNTVTDTLAMGASGSGVGTYNLSGVGILATGIQILGFDGRGTVNQSGGVNDASDTLFLGVNSGSIGIYRQSGGLNRANKLDLARNAGSWGVYVLSGGEFSVGEVSSGAGTSFLDVDGGVLSLGGSRLSVQTLTVGAAVGSDGSLTLGAGKSATTTETRIGFSGTGRFILDAGTHLVGGDLYVGANAGSNGTYTLRSGSLTATTEYIGFQGKGMFRQSGGTNTMTDRLVIGASRDADGEYHLLGGSVAAPRTIIGFEGLGQMSQGDGTSLTTDTLWLGVNSGSQGYYVQSGGTSFIGELRLGTSAQEHEQGSIGIYSLRGGTLHLKNLVAGFGDRRDIGRGTLVLDGGLFALVDRSAIRLYGLTLGELTGGDYTYALSDQQTMTVNMEYIGEGGKGAFVQYGGLHTVTRLALGSHAGASGSFSLSGGTLQAGDLLVGEQGSADFRQTGGTQHLLNLEVGTRGAFAHSGGSLIIEGAFQNLGTVTFAGASRFIHGDAVNRGTINVTNGSVTFGGAYTEFGVLASDPSVLDFRSVTIAETGYWVAGTDDEFHIAGDFINNSRQASLWNTNAASLYLEGSPSHDLMLAGADLGPGRPGYADNFAWHLLLLAAGEHLRILDGNDTPGAALYLDRLILGGGLDQLAQIHSSFNIYYDPSFAGNSYLSGLTYALDGGGRLMAAEPVPEPSETALLLCGLLLMGATYRQRALGARSRQGPRRLSHRVPDPIIPS